MCYSFLYSHEGLLMGNIHSILHRFLRHALRPLATICLRNGLKTRDFLHSLKLAFIDGAKAELRSMGEKESVSRIAVMTGLQRKDVGELLGTEEEAGVPSGLLMKVIGCWQHDARFCEKDGRPRKLQLENGEFEDLVRSVSTDLNHYTLLFELERLDAVTRIDKNTIELKSEVLNLSPDTGSALQLLATDLEHLTNCVTENIFNPQPIPNLHIKTQYDNISAEDIDEIRTKILELGTKFHADIRALLSMYDKDFNPLLHKKQGGVSIVVGSFSEVQK